QLQVDAVLKAQRLELILGNLAGETALHLPSELGDALGDEPMIEFIVTVHRSLLRSARVGPQWKALYWPAARRSSGRRRVSPRGSRRGAAGRPRRPPLRSASAPRSNSRPRDASRSRARRRPRHRSAKLG